MNEQDLATAFSAGMAIGILSQANPDESVASIERKLRTQFNEMEIPTENWISAYFEFLTLNLVQGDAISITELERNMSQSLSIGYAATQNLETLPTVGVYPNPDEEYGVPEEWTK